MKGEGSGLSVVPGKVVGPPISAYGGSSGVKEGWRPSAEPAGGLSGVLGLLFGFFGAAVFFFFEPAVVGSMYFVTGRSI